MRSDPSGPGGAPVWAEQAVDLQTALRFFAINGAVINKVEGVDGSLQAGKDTDFIVLDRNVSKVPITAVGQTQILLLVVTGVAVVDKLKRRYN